VDSGATVSDSGAPADAGLHEDADANTEAGAPDDAGDGTDASAPSGDASSSNGEAPGAGSSGGCGCTAAGSESTSPLAWLAGGARCECGYVTARH
jgi:hypothetical protein